MNSALVFAFRVNFSECDLKRVNYFDLIGDIAEHLVHIYRLHNSSFQWISSTRIPCLFDSMLSKRCRHLPLIYSNETLEKGVWHIFSICFASFHFSHAPHFQSMRSQYEIFVWIKLNQQIAGFVVSGLEYVINCSHTAFTLISNTLINMESVQRLQCWTYTARWNDICV